MSLGSGRGRFIWLWRCRLLYVPLGEQASGRRWDCSGLVHVAQRCFGTKWYSEVTGARSRYPRWWHRQWGRQQFCWFFKLGKYAMFSFAMTWRLMFKILITLSRKQKMEINDYIKISFSCINLYCIKKFAILAEIPCYQLMTVWQCFKIRGVIWGGWGGPSPPKEKEKRKKERKKKKKEKKKKKRKERKKGTMNNVNLLHIKCCYFPIFQ